MPFTSTGNQKLLNFYFQGSTQKFYLYQGSKNFQSSNNFSQTIEWLEATLKISYL
jgi:hypothetical protein